MQNQHQLSPREQLVQWFMQSTKGMRFAELEQELLQEQLPRLFGSICAVSAPYDLTKLADEIRCQRVYSLMSHGELEQSSKARLRVDLAHLPFAADELDAYVLVHGFDTASAPRDLLREAARVIRPGGQLIIVGFNPLSIHGLGKWVPGVRGRGAWAGKWLGRGQLHDWLDLLHFGLEHQQTQGLNHAKLAGLLSANSDFARPWQQSIKLLLELCGGLYIMRCRKVQQRMRLVGKAQFATKWHAPGIVNLSSAREYGQPVKPDADAKD